MDGYDAYAVSVALPGFKFNPSLQAEIILSWHESFARDVISFWKPSGDTWKEVVRTAKDDQRAAKIILSTLGLEAGRKVVATVGVALGGDRLANLMKAVRLIKDLLPSASNAGATAQSHSRQPDSTPITSAPNEPQEPSKDSGSTPHASTLKTPGLPASDHPSASHTHRPGSFPVRPKETSSNKENTPPSGIQDPRATTVRLATTQFVSSTVDYSAETLFAADDANRQQRGPINPTTSGTYTHTQHERHIKDTTNATDTLPKTVVNSQRAPISASDSGRPPAEHTEPDEARAQVPGPSSRAPWSHSPSVLGPKKDTMSTRGSRAPSPRRAASFAPVEGMGLAQDGRGDRRRGADLQDRDSEIDLESEADEEGMEGSEQ
ncbi:hypothetical protein FRC01_012450, partial [Tulasnella sp. 417]